MTDRLDPGGGGLTGATGDLTPDESVRPFVPGERKEQAGEEEQGRLTSRQGVGAPAQQGDLGDDRDPGDVPLGYGSGHGLSPEDPAYRMEVLPPGGTSNAEGSAPDRPARQPRQGVDTVADHDERF